MNTHIHGLTRSKALEHASSFASHIHGFDVVSCDCDVILLLEIFVSAFVEFVTFWPMSECLKTCDFDVIRRSEIFVSAFVEFLGCLKTGSGGSTVTGAGGSTVDPGNS